MSTARRRLITEWSATDPHTQEVLEEIAALPAGGPEYHDAVAALHLTEAREHWRRADQLRGAEAPRAPEARARRGWRRRTRNGPPPGAGDGPPVSAEDQV